MGCALHLWQQINNNAGCVCRMIIFTFDDERMFRRWIALPTEYDIIIGYYVTMPSFLVWQMLNFDCGDLCWETLRTLLIPC